MEHIKRGGRTLKHKGSILSFYEDDIMTPDGNVAKWDFIEHSGAAAVIPVLDDGRILLVRQFRNALDRETLEIPAGGINKGEEAYAAAMRELEEETGYKTLDSRKLAVMKSPALYGVSLRYNKANWMAEMGTENPFTHKNNYREYSCTNAYQYEQSRYQLFFSHLPAHC